MATVKCKGGSRCPHFYAGIVSSSQPSLILNAGGIYSETAEISGHDPRAQGNGNNGESLDGHPAGNRFCRRAGMGKSDG